LSTKLGSWKHLLPTNASVADGLESEVNIIVSDCIPLFFVFAEVSRSLPRVGATRLRQNWAFVWDEITGGCGGGGSGRPRLQRAERLVEEVRVAETLDLLTNALGKKQQRPPDLHYLCTSRFAKLWSLQDVAAELVAS
jgi:hypothetical protein